MRAKTNVWFAMMLLIAYGNARASEDAPCFSEDARSELTGITPMLAQQSDALAQHLIKANAPPGSIYLVTRQLALLERIQRRAEARGDYCESAINSIRRDYAALERTFKSYAEGNKALETERLTSPEAQALLKSVADPVMQLGAAIKRLQAG